MSSFVLKLIAVFSMTVDHIGYLFFPEHLFFRVIGRIAFPIYAFLIAEGYRKTSDRGRYAARLLIFAVLSEIPFDLVFSDAATLTGRLLDFSRQNVFFTLAAGFLAVWSHDRLTADGQPAAAYAAGMLCALASFFLMSDYSVYGAALIFLMYIYREKPAAMAASMGAVNALMVLESVLTGGAGQLRGYIQLAAVAAVPLLLLYNGRRGPRLKFLFYAYYPAHLLLFALIDRM